MLLKCTDIIVDDSCNSKNEFFDLPDVMLSSVLLKVTKPSSVIAISMSRGVISAFATQLNFVPQTIEFSPYQLLLQFFLRRIKMLVGVGDACRILISQLNEVQHSKNMILILSLPIEIPLRPQLNRRRETRYQ